MPYDIARKPGGLIVGRGRCSWYGGPNDSQDGGIGAWGFNSLLHPEAAYFSLPVPICEKFGLHGGMRVTAENAAGHQVRGFLGDKGPSEATGRLIDCCPKVLALLGVETDAILTVYVRPSEILTHAEQIAPAVLAAEGDKCTPL